MFKNCRVISDLFAVSRHILRIYNIHWILLEAVRRKKLYRVVTTENFKI